MTPTADPTLDLMAAGERLPPADRFRAAMYLLSTLEPTEEVVDAERAAMKAELTRRWERLRSGQERTYSVEEVMAALRAQHQARQV